MIQKKSQMLMALICTVFLAALTARAQEPTFQTVDGKTVGVPELRGKVVVLSFGATWVPLAAKELPALQKLADRYAPRGVQIYWVSVNSAKAGGKNFMTDADLAAFADKRGLHAPVLRDPEQAAYRAYGVDALPTIVILGKDGRVVRKHVGFDPDQGEAYGAVMKELDQLLK
ncbi:MAG: TlpA family protein disulfide reductase [Acidobacteria bacterium]|nr:TlpA family protein disulfide reductase [Acidobacteriota bacterium]MBI3427959.1 TlpA family protein disulfide reductase [Acidobacteriota bacterium]